MDAHLLARNLPGVLLFGSLTGACATIDTYAVEPEPPPVVETVVPVEEEPGESAELNLADAEGAAPMTPCLTGDGVFYVTTDDPKRPLTRYADGQLSLSNSCGIRMENKLNRKIPPIYVNGQPVGFC